MNGELGLQVVAGLGRLEGKLEAFSSLLGSHTARLDKHEERLTKIEGARMWVLGAAVAVAFAVPELPKLIHKLAG